MNRLIRCIVVFAFLLILPNYLMADEKDGYNIKIKVKGLETDTICYLVQRYGEGQKIIDSVKVGNGGLLEFSGQDKLPGGIYLVIIPKVMLYQLIIDEQNFTITTDIENLIESTKVKNSIENQVFYEYQKFGLENNKKTAQINELLEKHKGNSDSVRIINEQLRRLKVELVKYNNSFVEAYPESFFTKILLASKPIDIPEPPKDYKGEEKSFKLIYLQKHFFDQIDFSDERFLRTELLHEKITYYIEKLTVPYPDSMVKSVDHIINKARANKEVFKYAVSKLFNTYNKIDKIGNDFIFVHIGETYYLSGEAYWVDSVFLQNVKKQVVSLKPALPGNIAQDVALLDTSFIPVPLHSIDADLTVMFFYEPDCGHCKKLTPKLYKLYEKYHEQGIAFYAVCTKTDVDEWKEFINKYALDWINVADPYFNTNFKYYYNIKSTPKTFVLDKDKKILLNMNIGVEQLEKFINSRLTSKNK